MPACDQRKAVGRMLVIPHSAAGTHMDPPVSVPTGALALLVNGTFVLRFVRGIMTDAMASVLNSISLSLTSLGLREQIIGAE
jgi:hypothetical protein